MYNVTVKGKDIVGYKDNYYVSLYSNSYTQHMHDLLDKQAFSMYIRTIIDGYTDESFTDVYAANDIIKIYDVAKFNVTFFINKNAMTDGQITETVSFIEQTVRNEKQYGSYDVCFIDFSIDDLKSTADCISFSKNNRSLVEHHQFNTFDLRRA